MGKEIIRGVGEPSQAEFESKNCDVFYFADLKNNQHGVNVLRSMYSKLHIYQDQPTNSRLNNGSFYVVGFNHGNSDLLHKLSNSKFMKKKGLELMVGDELNGNINIITQIPQEKPFIGEEEYGFKPISK